MALLGFGLAYTARGYLSFESLRDLHWYLAIPQMGCILFAAGWWSGRRGGAPVPRERPARCRLLAVVGLLAVALALQAPRVRAHLIAWAPPLTESERPSFPIPRLQRLRARYLRSEEAAGQRRFLARLDRAEARARAGSMGRETIRAALAGSGPGKPALPPIVPGVDAVDLLALPEGGSPLDPALVRSTLLPLLVSEPEPRPPWLRPEERWPPGRGGNAGSP